MPFRFTFNDQRVSAPTAAALAARVNEGKLQLELFDLRAPQQWWPLPAGTKLANALAWSSTLHDATFAILDRLGRQCALKVANAERAAAAVSRTQMQRYIAIKTDTDLRTETYLNLPPRLARPLYNSRADNQQNEESARRRPLQPFNSTTVLKRIEDPLLRACYNCAALAPNVSLRVALARDAALPGIRSAARRVSHRHGGTHCRGACYSDH